MQSIVQYRGFFGAEARQGRQVGDRGLEHGLDAAEALPEQARRLGADAGEGVEVRGKLGATLVAAQTGDDEAVGRIADVLQQEQLRAAGLQGQRLLAARTEDRVTQLAGPAAFALGDGGQGELPSPFGQGAFHGLELPLAAVDEQQVRPGRTHKD